MKKYLLMIMSLLFLVLLAMSLSTCGGGGGSSESTDVGVSLADLEGTWFGVYEDGNTDELHTVSLTMDSSGNFTQHQVDGSDTGETGSFTKVGNYIFDFVDSDNMQGTIIVSQDASHACFFTDAFIIGILEKGAAGLPIYVKSDMAGVWSEYGYYLDSSMGLSDFGPITATVQDNFLLTWSLDIGGTGSYSIQDLSFGFYYGTNFGNEIVESFISPDKSYIATYVNFGGPWPQDYQVFSGYKR
jgi:hypothetical protein